MDKAQFWQIIEASRSVEAGSIEQKCDAQAKALKPLLLQLAPQEIVEFDRIFFEFDRLAYRWDLWAVAYYINGGASDDGFTYFRWWLISQGREYFERALENVQNAGDNVAPDDEAECEAVAYCVNAAYREKTGEDIPLDPLEQKFPPQPQGERFEWADEAEFAVRYPRLFEKFG